VIDISNVDNIQYIKREEGIFPYITPDTGPGVYAEAYNEEKGIVMGYKEISDKDSSCKNHDKENSLEVE